MRAVFQNNLKHRPFFGPHSAGDRIGARLRIAPGAHQAGVKPYHSEIGVYCVLIS